MKFDCDNLIKAALIYIKKYKINSKSWVEIMEDENIPTEIKNLLNGLRYIYSNEVNEKIEKCCNFKELQIKVYPTGSKNLTSDIDTQMSLNLDKKYTIQQLEDIFNKVIKLLNESKDLWKIVSIEKTLDINFYPPTFINFSNKKIKKHYILSSEDKDESKVYKYMFFPQINNKKLYNIFLKNEKDLLKNYKHKYYNHNTKKYYSKYNKEIVKCLYDLMNKNYIDDNYNDDLEINQNINCLIKYASIGPEMYFTYSSVLLVVWFIQLGHSIPLHLIRQLSPIAIKEHQLLYKITNKDKYLERINLLNQYL